MIWRPTMNLRWFETDNYNPILDEYERRLQQEWQSDSGDSEWRFIEVFG